MRVNKHIKSVYDSASAEVSATIYNFGTRLKTSDCLRRVKVLQYENALLTRAVSETRNELVRLRELLAASPAEPRERAS
jgi:hypothetical protein